MLPLRALKKAVFSKFDKSNDFDPSLQHFRHTSNSLPNTNEDDYPYGIYVFSTEDDTLVMGDKIPVSLNVILTFHLFSLGEDSNGIPQPSTECENLIEDLTDKLATSPTLNIESNVSNNWKNPTLGIMDQNIVSEPETDNWHGLVRYRVIAGR